MLMNERLLRSRTGKLTSPKASAAATDHLPANRGRRARRAEGEAPRTGSSCALVLTLISAAVFALGLQAFVSAQRELAAYDAAASRAPDSAVPPRTAERVTLLRNIALEQTAFVLCGTTLALALWFVARRPFWRFGRRPLEPEARTPAARNQLPDISELHHLNRLATVGRLTAGMAHEFGTPLGVVLARAQMIASDESDLDDMRADAGAIIIEVKRMTQMCREVLDYARPRAPLTVPTDLVQIARHMLVLLLPDVRKRNVKLSLAGDPQPLFALGDASKLTQILTNLIINALQATPQGGAVVLRVERVRAQDPEAPAAPERSYACVRVQDTGSGIRAADLPHIFETFFTTKKQGEGTGLGLAVSDRIAREHGGWIGVTTKEEQGACFSLYLPLAGVEQAA